MTGSKQFIYCYNFLKSNNNQTYSKDGTFLLEDPLKQTNKFLINVSILLVDLKNKPIKYRKITKSNWVKSKMESVTIIFDVVRDFDKLIDIDQKRFGVCHSYASMLGFYYKILEDKIDKVDKINRANSVLNYFNVYIEDSTHIPEEFRNFYGLYLERVMSDHYKYKKDMGMDPMYTYIKLVGGLIPVIGEKVDLREEDVSEISYSKVYNRCKYVPESLTIIDKCKTLDKSTENALLVNKVFEVLKLGPIVCGIYAGLKYKKLKNIKIVGLDEVVDYTYPRKMQIQLMQYY